MRVRLRGISTGAVLTALAVLAGGASAGAEELTFSVMESGTYDKAALGMAPGFQEKTGATVNVVAFPWAVLRQNNTTDLLTGAGQYDVMSGGYYLADVYTYFAPLTDMIAKDGYGTGMIDGLMQPGRSEWLNGQQIGIPYGIDSYGLLVNTELLAEAGVSDSLPDWDAVEAACEALAAKAPDVACLSHPTGNPEQIGAFFFSGYDGPFIDAAGAYHLDVDRAVAAASVLPELWAHLPSQGSALTFDEAHQLFKDGKAAMLVTWPSFVTRALDDNDSAVKGKWEQVPFPGAGFPWLSLWQLFVPTTTENKDLAWEWIKTFAGPDNAKSNYVDHNIGSVWLSVYDDPELKALHAHHWPAMVGDFARAKNPPLSGEAQDFLTNTLQDVANGRVSAADAIASVNSTWATIPVPPALAEAAAGAGLVAQ